MNLAIDIIVALIGVALIALYTYRGFVRLLLDASKLIIAFMVSRLIVPLIVPNEPILGLVLYVVIFILVCIALTFLFKLIDKIIKKIPIIRTLNVVLGLILGIGFVYLIFSMAAVIFGTLAAYAPETPFGIAEAQLAEGSKIYGFFAEHGLFSIFS